MKKWFCALGMMLALLMSVALADGVKVTFAEKNGQINGGYDYTLKLNVSPASDKDLTVSLTCDGLDGAYSVVIPAGQKSTMLTVPTQVVEERGKVVFELQSGDGYTGAGKHTLTIQRLPNVQFYLGINFGTVGKKMSVRMTVTNSSTIVKGNNIFQLRDDKGTVLAEAKWSNPSGDGYTGAGKHTLTIQRLPNVQFYLGINFGTVGKKMSVRMTVTNSSTIVKGNNIFQLRDDKGTVLAEAKWSNPSGDMSFSITPTADMEGYTRLSVWLGDRCVADGGYLTVVAKGQRAVKNVETERKLVGIGMDCGFGGKNTDQVLEVLAKHNTNITFFMTGYFVRTFPEESKRVLAAGNEIGDHTNTHPQLTKERPYSMMRQIVFPAETMAETLGVSPRLMRPPYGDVNSNVISVSRAEGMECVLWNMSTKDSIGKYTVEECIKNGTTRAKLAPGNILLCHLDANHSWEILDAVLNYYEEQGYTVLPISALIYATGGSLPPMPSTREAMLYTDDYWPNWLAERGIEIETKE